MENGSMKLIMKVTFKGLSRFIIPFINILFNCSKSTNNWLLCKI